MAVCSTVTSTVVTSPASLCAVTACAACDNGNAVSDNISSDSRDRAGVTSSISSFLNSDPVPTGRLSAQADGYRFSVARSWVSYSDMTCFSPSDVEELLTAVGDTIDQVDDSIQQYGDAMKAALGDSTYINSVESWMYALSSRVLANDYSLWLSQGCVDWDLVANINEKIDAFNAKYNGLTNGNVQIPHLKSPCRDVLSYSSVPASCHSSACNATPVPASSCASCNFPSASVSAFQSNLAAATSTLSAAVAFATSTPFNEHDLLEMLAAKNRAEFDALDDIQSSEPGAPSYTCMTLEQSHAYLSSLTAYFNSLSWSLEQSAVLEYAAGGPVGFVNNFVIGPWAMIYSMNDAMQTKLSDAASCYDCNDVFAYNAAIGDFIARYNEYIAFSGYSFETLPTPQLSLDCTQCTPSSVPLSSSSTPVSVSAPASNLASASASASASVSASTSASTSAFASASASASNSVPVASSVASSTDATSSVTSVASAASDSASASASDDTIAISSGFSAGESTVYSLSAVASSSVVVNSSGTGYSNITSTTQTAPASTSSTVSSESGVSTRTFTTTTVVTEPCGKCPGGSTTFTTTSTVTEPCETAIASSTTRATTAVVTEPCEECVGGITIYTTTAVVTEACDSSASVVATTSESTTAVVTEACDSSASVVATTSESTTAVASPVSTSASTPEASPADVSAVAVSSDITTTNTITGIVTKTATGASSVAAPALASSTSVSVAGTPEASQTSVVAANSGNRDAWFSFVFMLVPALAVL